jgi:hypothetical protein
MFRPAVFIFTSSPLHPFGAVRAALREGFQTKETKLKGVKNYEKSMEAKKQKPTQQSG